jgi:hypothetical protein
MRGVPPVVVPPVPAVTPPLQSVGRGPFCGRAVRGFEPPVSEPGVDGVSEGGGTDCPVVGAGVGPVPLGRRLPSVPVPGVPELEGVVND